MAYRSKGDGTDNRAALANCGASVVIEAGARIFHPEKVYLSDGVYIGHDAMLEGHHNGELHIGERSWVGAKVFINAAGTVIIGQHVGVGPGVHILSSVHREAGRNTPILRSPLEFAPVRIEDGADIGVQATILPGVRIGRGAQVGAAAVVSRDIPAYAVVAGVPARIIRMREKS